MHVPESVKIWLKKATVSSECNDKEAIISTKVNGLYTYREFVKPNKILNSPNLKKILIKVVYKKNKFIIQLA